MAGNWGEVCWKREIWTSFPDAACGGVYVSRVTGNAGCEWVGCDMPRLEWHRGKKGRESKLKILQLLDCPIIIYESAIRLPKTLNDISIYFGDETEVFVAREMTKIFEEYWGGKIGDVISDLSLHKLTGEIVLIVKK